MEARTWLIDIAEAECAQLLSSTTLGRFAVVVDGRPEIFPVNHVYDRDSGCVAFPTNARTKLHGALAWPWVAYEVDGVTPDGASGWSVLVVGRAEEVTDPDDIDRLAQQRQALWRSSSTTHWLRIVASKVTGRRITAADS